MQLIPKNWPEFQHYKDRNPTWIKLHKALLDDSAFQRLPVASRALAPMLWLLASESKDGQFDATASELAFRLRQTEREIEAALKPLIDKGFFTVLQAASDLLADGKRDASPEERREETEKSKGRFEDFWKAWPKSERKQDRKKCAAKWAAEKLDGIADQILADIATKKLTQKWQGGFIEAPEVYLNNRRWEDGVTPDEAPAHAITIPSKPGIDPALEKITQDALKAVAPLQRCGSRCEDSQERRHDPRTSNAHPRHGERGR